MKQELWETLLAVLYDVLALYQSLLKLSEQKRHVLVAAKPQELEAITKQEEVLILQASQLEKARQTATQRIMAEQPGGQQMYTLRDLQEIADDETADKIAAYLTEMNAVMKKMQQLNTLNTQLIEQSLGYIQYNINVLSRTAVGPSYAPEGEREQAGARPQRVFDAKI